MGYNLYVTRKEYWADEHGPEIELEEWMAIIAADPSLELRGQQTADLSNGSQLVATDPTLTVWINDMGAEAMWFYLFEGNITGKSPRPPAIAKMHEIATRMDAHLMGEEGELYDAKGCVVYTDFEDAAPTMAEAKPRPWWKFW